MKMAGPGRLECGHPVGWMIRLRDGPKVFKFCWGCIIEKSGVKEIGSLPPPEELKASKNKVVAKEK
jgi:hypothetical protein